MKVGKKFELPNRMTVYSLNEYETNFLYKEIFEEKTYIKHGIQINDKSVIFDVGANIGLFTLWVQNEFSGATVFAFEPIPDIFEILNFNTASFNNKVKAFQMGLSNRKGEVLFSFYPNYSILSGCYTDFALDGRLFRSGIYNSLNAQEVKDNDPFKEHVDRVVEDKLGSRKEYRCPITTISNFIREQNIPQIDLLKIDVERAEEDVLNGIQDADWSKIKQIVMEVHDSVGILVPRIIELLKAKEFRTIIDEEEQLRQSGTVNIYASKI